MTEPKKHVASTDEAYTFLYSLTARTPLRALQKGGLIATPSPSRSRLHAGCMILGCIGNSFIPEREAITDIDTDVKSQPMHSSGEERV